MLKSQIRGMRLWTRLPRRCAAISQSLQAQTGSVGQRPPTRHILTPNGHQKTTAFGIVSSRNQSNAKYDENPLPTTSLTPSRSYPRAAPCSTALSAFKMGVNHRDLIHLSAFLIRPRIFSFRTFNVRYCHSFQCSVVHRCDASLFVNIYKRIFSTFTTVFTDALFHNAGLARILHAFYSTDSRSLICSRYFQSFDT